MILAAISYLGTLNTLGIEGKNNSSMYCDVLLELSMPSAAESFEERWTLQQDSVSVHSSSLTS